MHFTIAFSLALGAHAAADTLRARTASAKPPNIVFLMVDSMDGRVVDPTSNVSAFVQTPALDGLANEGVNFVNAYTASPQCVPGRAAMLTGLRPDQTRAFDNGHGMAAEPSGALDANCVGFYDAETCGGWAQAQAAGNVSSLLDVAAAHANLTIYGKIDLGANALERFGPAVTSADGFHNGPSLPIVTRGASVARPTKPDPTAITDEDCDHVHQEDWTTIDRCVEYLEAGPAANFFLHCSLNIPHPSFQTNATWLASVDRDLVRQALPAWAASQHPYDAYMSASKNVTRDYTDSEIAEVRETYFGMVAEADYLLGRVIDATKANGYWDDSFVVFVSDHGEMNMEKRQVWKNSMYEASARVPFIVSGGRVPKGMRGTVAKDLVSLLDVFPTFNAMLGASADHLRGLNLLPRVLGDAPADANRSVVAQYHSNMGDTGAFMVRSGDWKYVRFATAQFPWFEDYAPRLFDVAADPDEAIDVAADRADVVAALESALRAELAAGWNRVSEGGDPEEVSAHAMGLNRAVYARFFLNESSRLRANHTLRQLLDGAYGGFDDADQAKVDAWYGNFSIAAGRT